MMRAILVTTLLGALCVATASAADPCPSNVSCVAGLACVPSTAASGGQEANFNGGASAWVRYNWIMGIPTYVTPPWCEAYSQLPFHSSVPMDGTIEANEDFVVTGIPPGTPLSIHARIRVVASAGSTGGLAPSNHASGWLEEAGAGRVEAVANAEGVNSTNIDEIRSLDFPNLAGEPFRLTMGATTRSLEGTSRALVSLSFADLPPGAVVSSCQGYSSGPPVPAPPVSWGRLKLRYR